MPRGLWARVLTSSTLRWGWRAHAYGIKRNVASCELLMSPLGSKQSRWFHFAFYLVAGRVGGRCGRRDKFKFHYNVCLAVWWLNFYWHDFLATGRPVQSLDSARLSSLFHYTSPTRERGKIMNFARVAWEVAGWRWSHKIFVCAIVGSHSRINLGGEVCCVLAFTLCELVIQPLRVCISRIDKFSTKIRILFAFTTSRLTYKMFMTFREIVFDLLAQITCERKASAHFTRERKVLCVVLALALANVVRGKARQHFAGFNLHKFDI